MSPESTGPVYYSIGPIDCSTDSDYFYGLRRRVAERLPLPYIETGYVPQSIDFFQQFKKTPEYERLLLDVMQILEGIGPIVASGVDQGQAPYISIDELEPGSLDDYTLEPNYSLRHGYRLSVKSGLSTKIEEAIWQIQCSLITNLGSPYKIRHYEDERVEMVQASTKQMPLVDLLPGRDHIPHIVDPEVQYLRSQIPEVLHPLIEESIHPNVRNLINSGIMLNSPVRIVFVDTDKFVGKYDMTTKHKDGSIASQSLAYVKCDQMVSTPFSEEGHLGLDASGEYVLMRGLDTAVIVNSSYWLPRNFAGRTNGSTRELEMNVYVGDKVKALQLSRYALSRADLLEQDPNQFAVELDAIRDIGIS